MSNIQDIGTECLSRQALRDALFSVGESRYHNLHPFHRQMVAGQLTKGQLQAWALNRYCYQSAIPRKDSLIMAQAESAEFRAAWRSRIDDHDGSNGRDGGIARWLHLASGLGLDPDLVRSERMALPATRFAVNAYATFCARHTLLEAVASSLTELFSPSIISERVPALLARYGFVTEDSLAYFAPRREQAARDSDFALTYVLDRADTPERQQRAIDALAFKCDVLWAMLDALDYAYGAPGRVPFGAFEPEAHQ